MSAIASSLIAAEAAEGDSFLNTHFSDEVKLFDDIGSNLQQGFGGLIDNPTTIFSDMGTQMHQAGSEFIANPSADTVLGVLESPILDLGLVGVGSGLALGAGASVSMVAAPLVVGFAAGTVGGIFGNAVGTSLGHYIAGKAGYNHVSTEGDTCARVGDDIAHQNKDAGLWGALAAVVIGAAIAAVAIIAAPVTLTIGAACLIAAGVGLAAGVAGGVAVGIGNALGEYGDNKGKIFQGSPDVFFNSRAVARAGDPIECSDHQWDPPPIIAEGAKTVFANNQPIARLGHRTQCDGNINSASPNIAETKETSELVCDIIDSRSKWLRWAIPITKVLAFLGLCKLAQHKADQNRKQSDAGENNSSQNTNTDGDPVDVVTGDYFQKWPVIEIVGVLPLTLNRLYRSGADFKVNGMLGPKWANSWSQCLMLYEDHIDYVNEEGVILSYHVPDSPVHAINLREKRYFLYGDRQNSLFIFDYKTQTLLTFNEKQGYKRYLSKIEDRTGNHILFHYEKGCLCKIDHSDGYSLHIQNLYGHLFSVDLVSDYQTERLLTCQYDKYGNLSDCHSFQFGRLYHEYDAHGYMTRWRDTDATDVRIQYNINGQVISLGSKEGYFKDRFEYDPLARKNIYHDAEGGQTTYFYNERNLVTKVIDPLGNITLTEWDITQKISQTDALGRTTRYEYTDYGALAKIIDVEGRTFSYHYDRFGQITQVQNFLGDQLHYHHDERGLLRSINYPSGDTIDYRYNDKGQLLRETYSTGQEWRYEYNASGLLSKVINPDGNATCYEFDLLRRIRSKINPLGDKINYGNSDFHANPQGSITRINLPEGITQTIDYTSERLPFRFTDGEGKKTEYEYGAFDLLLSKKRPDGKLIRYHYDNLIRLSGITNAKGERYTLIRDAVGRVIEECDFTGRSQYYQYDAVGRLLSKTVGNQITSYFYGARDQLIQLTTWLMQENHARCEDQICYEYNARDQLTKVTNSEATVEFLYDDQGRLIGESINGHTINYEWDETTEQLLSLHHADLALNYRYTATGILEQLQVGEHMPLQLKHDLLGRETLCQSEAGFVLAHNYNANGMLISQGAGHYSEIFNQQPGLIDFRQPLIGTAVSRQYRYDKAFNVTGIEDRTWGLSTYNYNTNDQITGAQFAGSRGTKQVRLGYDANLNMIDQIEQQDTLAKTTQKQEMHHGRVVRLGENTYRYNEQGQLIEKCEVKAGFRPQIWKYRWNARGQLIELLTPDLRQWRYAYDAFGRRIRKFEIIQGGKALPKPLSETMPDNDPSPTLSDTTSSKMIGYDYFWSGDRLIEEIPIYADGTLAYDASIHWLYKKNELSPFARYQHGTLHYVIADQIGTPREMLDEWGKLVWMGRNEVWGKFKRFSQAANDSNPPTCNLRFLGQYEDEESGLHYNRFRYYDPATAQYISPDPIGIAGGINPYGYVHNPNGWVDPLGLANYDKLSGPNPLATKKLQPISEAYEDLNLGKTNSNNVEVNRYSQSDADGGRIPTGYNVGDQKIVEPRSGTPNAWTTQGTQTVKEYVVLNNGQPTNHRVLERTRVTTSGATVKDYGYVVDHNYKAPKPFPMPWYPTYR